MKTARLNLEDYKPVKKEYRRLRDDINKILEPKIFDFETSIDLNYAALKLFFPSLKKANKEYYAAIDTVLTYFGLAHKKGDVQVIITIANRTRKVTPVSPSRRFCNYIIGFDKPPIKELNILKPQVERDLQEFNKFVNERYQIESIRNILAPDSKIDNTKVEFYLRSIELRQEILDYYTTGVYKSAVQKSRSFDYMTPGRIFMQETDFPYKMKLEKMNYDFENIDSSKHRFEVEYQLFLRPNLSHLPTLYNTNKDLFYVEYFNLKPIESIFDRIKYWLAELRLEHKLSIFEELKRLFDLELWYGFYALALPQIEGFFSEMNSLSDPQSSILRKSLPIKVDKVRPQYGFSSYFFDYFQFLLPTERNRFAHTGKIDEPRLRSFDLLIDLEFILGVFIELENPLRIARKHISRKNIFDFSNIYDLDNFLELVLSIKRDVKLKKEDKTEVVEFAEGFILRETNVIYTIQNSLNLLESRLSSAYLLLNSYNGFEDFQAWKGEDFAAYSKNEALIATYSDFCEIEFMWLAEIGFNFSFLKRIAENFGWVLKENTFSEQWGKCKEKTMKMYKLDLQK